MGKESNGSGRNTRTALTLDSISKKGEASSFGFFMLLFIFFLAIFFVVTTSTKAREMLQIGNAQVPVSAMTGVFSSFSNITMILMVVFYKKKGFITALILLLLQYPMLVYGLMAQHAVTNIAGLFTNTLTIISIIIIYVNNKARNAYQRKVSEQAVTDRLTGLPNRFAGSELVNDMISDGRRFSLVSLDISNFKSINETLGYAAGNNVLRQIAERMKTIADDGSSGTVDFVTRQAGDEFLIVVRDYSGEQQVMDAVNVYKEALEKKITVDECDLFLTGSFGVAEYPVDALTADTLLSCAVAARYEVKRANSSDRVRKFTADMLKVEHTLEIEREIRSALKNDTIYFNLQPQYDMQHRICGFEALARMKDREGNNIHPSDFIPVAEKAGIIDKVDSTVFRKAAVFFGELMRSTGADLTLSINVSVRHLMKNGFFDEMKSIIDESGISPDHLEIEITESIMIDSAEKALRCIGKVKEMGIRIAIDDFGTGYSSLSYLHRFPADLLKVDKSFIDKMNQSESSKDYVASIISIGHIMNFSVIAEGVEEEAQLQTLSDIGCDMVQGFVWGRPLSEEEAQALVQGSSAAGAVANAEKASAVPGQAAPDGTVTPG